MKPLPWSYTALDDFKNCPRQYYEKRIAKSVKTEETPEMIWGTEVHKHFELRQAQRRPLPEMLEAHEPFMEQLEGLPGNYFACEQEIAFDVKGQPCNWQIASEQIWCRGIIDYMKIDEAAGRAALVDYKTGKPHEKFEQLALFALHTFAMFPTVSHCRASFYWTKTFTSNHKIWSREEIPSLWARFIPHLKQYKQAFSEDVWQPRPSGLCYGWCPVKDCEHWRPKRKKS